MGAAGLLPQPRAQQQFLCLSVPLLGGCREPPPVPWVPAGLRSLLSFLLQTLPVSAKRCLLEGALTRNSPRWKIGTGSSREPRCGAAPRRGFLEREPGLSRMEAGSGRQSGLHARPGFCAGFPRDLGQIPSVLPNFSVWERDSLSPASSSRISRGPQRTFEKALGNKALFVACLFSPRLPPAEEVLEVPKASVPSLSGARALQTSPSCCCFPPLCTTWEVQGEGWTGQGTPGDGAEHPRGQSRAPQGTFAARGGVRRTPTPWQ